MRLQNRNDAFRKRSPSLLAFQLAWQRCELHMPAELWESLVYAFVLPRYKSFYFD
jgi:hypothetical protein